MHRRNFIKSSIAISSLAAIPESLPAFENKMKVIVLNTDWGWAGSVEDLLIKSKAAGYDGIETWWSSDGDKMLKLFRALEKHEMQVGILCGSSKSDFASHKADFEKSVHEAASNTIHKPLYINCHSGKDFFTEDQNSQLVDITNECEKKYGIDIYHETHRSRMCYSLPLTRALLDRNPAMRITLDASHWTNVHESLLADQEENLNLALSKTFHIHARIGHQEGPQVNDPRAPEWSQVEQVFFGWWDKVVKHRESSGSTHMTFLTEFGPPNYMPTLPYTKQAVSNQWEINEYMLHKIKNRYSKS